MSFSIRSTIRALVAPEHQLSCPARLWREGLKELGRRGGGRRESGAFLLGNAKAGAQRGRRYIQRIVYYDDLDPHCLDSGVVVFDGAGFGPLWKICREVGLSVVADVHTHPPGGTRQSEADRRHPMIATPGHIALIVPDYAERPVRVEELGIYEYLGSHEWRNHSGAAVGHFFYTGIFA